MDSMRSIDSTRNRQLKQESNEIVIQPSILKLFPSLDYSRTDVVENSKMAMNTQLRVLLIAAENGFVNKYSLANERAEPRFASQSATDALEKLEKTQLLSMTQNVGKTGVKRNDFSLTAKGLIVCLVFEKYQKWEDFSTLVKKSSSVENELSFTLLLYNRFPALLTDTLKELATRHLDFERLTDENIVSEIRKMADLLALKSTKNPGQFIAELLMETPEALLLKISKDFIEMSKDLKELSKVAPEKRAWAISTSSDFLASLFSGLASPEFRLWIITGQDFNELHLLIDKMKSRTFNNEIELAKVFDSMRTEIRERLKCIEVRNFL